jgi:hypothetical protein
MTGSRSTALVKALRDPSQLAHFTLAEWSELVQQARTAGLLGRTAHLAGRAFSQGSGTVPDVVAGHFESALRLWRAQLAEIERESRFLRAALADLDAPVVILKGAAYVLAGLPAASGRLFSDIDLLVPKAAIGRAESLLQLHGWMGTHANAYDQRYYREWMHELPPMQHVHRQTTVDLHHTILPETSRLRPDAAALVEAAVALPGHAGLSVLAPADMVLHSMTHLFMNDELSHALRDLSDLDLLLRHFGREPGFWQALPVRAERHQLGRVLHDGLRYTRHLLGTPVPEGVDAALKRWAPGGARQRAMDALWLRALLPAPAQPTAAGAWATKSALLALYVRGHWLRMPPALLARHLTVKALRLHTAPDAAEKQTVG